MYLIEVAHPCDHDAIGELENVVSDALQDGWVLSLLRQVIFPEVRKWLGLDGTLLKVFDPLPRRGFDASSHALIDELSGRPPWSYRPDSLRTSSGDNTL